MEIEPNKIGIALSGGGARGLAHIGVLSALEDYGISPYYVAGASAGALIGVFYAAGFSPEEIFEIFKDTRFNRVWNWNLPKDGLLDLTYMLDILKENIEHDDFEHLKRYFFVSVTNLNSGKNEIHDSGKLFQRTLASASIPIIFKPQVIDGKTYVDGGFLNTLPVEPIKEACDFIIGVHVNRHGELDNIKGMRAIGDRIFRLTLWQNVKPRLEQCDFVIEPQDAVKYGTFEFDKVKELYDIGYKEAENKMRQFFGQLNWKKLAKKMEAKS